MRISADMMLRANKAVLAGLLGTPMLLFLSLFFFDDPSTAGNPFVYLAFFAVWAYPVAAFFAARRSIRAHREGDVARLRRQTWITCSLPAAVLLFIAISLAAEVAAGLAWMARAQAA